MRALRQVDVTKMYKNIATYKTKNTKTPFCWEREKPLRLHAPPYANESDLFVSIGTERCIQNDNTTVVKELNKIQ